MTTTLAYHACWRKRLFWTEQAAKDAIAQLYVRTGSHGLHVYQCPHAQAGFEHLHIGHVRRKDEVEG